jgi:hypothetical protein
MKHRIERIVRCEPAIRCCGATIMAASYAYRLRTLSFGVLAALFIFENVLGQESPTSPITAEHELLKQDVGTWDTEIKVWPSPDAEPIASKGRETSKLLPGGLWLETRFEGMMASTPCVGVGTWGYDPAEKKYVGTWVDSMTPHVTYITGEYDPKTRTMTHTSEGRDPATGEKFTRKSTLRYMADGTRLVEAYATGPDRQTWKTIEVKYTLRRRTR